MPRHSKIERRKAKKMHREAYAAAHNQRFDSFEPDLRVPQMRMRAAEDESVVNEHPLTEEETIKDQASMDARKQMLTVAMDKDAQERQNMPFLGSVTQSTIKVAKEADAAGAADMQHADWTHFHEEMYAKHLPFSAACYKLFRRACEGNALRDAEFVKLLLIGKLRESGRIEEKLADDVAAKYVTKRHMYNQLRTDVEEKRAAAALAAASATTDDTVTAANENATENATSATTATETTDTDTTATDTTDTPADDDLSLNDTIEPNSVSVEGEAKVKADTTMSGA